MENHFLVLAERGYIYQTTHESEIINSVNGEPMTFYLGIDPTADSLHIGHFFALMLFRRLQEAGHKGICVIGGATALIGDPSGKSDLRKILTKEEVAYNLEEVKTLVKRFVITDGNNPAIILNNADWLNQYNYVDFMRYVGLHFNMNKMLSADTYAMRLKEGGLTFLEMGYMLMQAYDFVYLNRQYNCILQIGGSDQWGNIVAGINLHRKLNYLEGNDDNNESLYGLTCPLLLTKDGKKMGKTENGTLWVAREKTTIFDFYQYFYNVNDNDVSTLLRLFTRIPTSEIEILCKDDILLAKRKMVYEITKLVHGEEEANKIYNSINAIYGKQSNIENIPNFIIEKNIIEQGINIIELLTISGFISTKSEARRMINQGGISVDGIKINNENFICKIENSNINQIVLQKGKKKFLRITFN